MFALDSFELYRNNLSGLYTDYKYRYALPFEKMVDPIEKTISFQKNWIQTVAVSIGYFFIIKLIQYSMNYRSAFKLRWPLFIWNLSLALFNIFGFIRFGEDMIHTLLYEGVYRSLCYSVNPTDVAAYWSYLFFLSKIVELGDTLFIVLRKKPLIFLHYYHHTSVLIYSAHSGAENTGSGKALILMNFLAHSAMYTYFAVASYGKRPPKTISMTLTTIQTVQMFVGIGVLAYVYKIKTGTNLPCQQSMQNLLFGALLYVTFAVLFIHYFISKYLRKSDKKVKDQ
ncbi:GNS1/SUR4 family protein [Loa loa]|uniref:Elongation of very long chain fatty acids protein n=1 Tax=Loa loa TaxID=7209 RepID=A0A1S0TWF9_LOALO|nr:GNS1/SUR4 family protein [Loa loa]EFO20598.1 GNS1/SUR4 family protein [Loa loa]